MNCEIRKWRLSDAGDLAAALSNPRVLNNLRDGLPYPYTAGDGEAYIRAMLSADENDTFAFAITVDDRCVGSIGAFRQGNIHGRTAELGYYLAEEYWGQGLMTQAIRLLCRWVFANTDILRIYAEPFSYNTGSCRALEKAGFQYEGLMKNNAVKNGKLLDMKLYALTRDEAPFTVRHLLPEQLPDACGLVWQVFCRFEAPEYSQEGIDEFKKTLQNEKALRHMPFYGAFHAGELVGVLAMRESQHISLFFVKEAWHRQGVGRLLFDAMRRDYAGSCFTVNSSPYAVEVYRHLGFVPTDSEQLTNGIRYTPMRFEEREQSQL